MESGASSTLAGRARRMTLGVLGLTVGLWGAGQPLRAEELDSAGGVEVPGEVREALLEAFPGQDGLRIEPEVLFLSERELAGLSELVGRDFEPVVVRYEVRAARVPAASGEPGPNDADDAGDVDVQEATLGVGYLDTHRVRTLSESVLLILDASGKVQAVTVLAFGEPEEYLPHERWYAQFKGLPIERPIKYGREIDAVTGATLTGRSTVDALSRVAAVHQTLLGRSTQRSTQEVAR